MDTRDDADLARLLHRLVTDVLTWVSEHPDDRVDPAAVASVRRSVDGVLSAHPDATANPDTTALTVAAGLLVDVAWWLDACEDDEVDPDVAVNVLESSMAILHELPEEQRLRLLQVLAALGDAEPHDGRRYRWRLFPFAMGFADEEPECDEPAVLSWVRPEDRPRLSAGAAGCTGSRTAC